MANRVLIVFLFILSIIISSGITSYLIKKNNEQGGISQDELGKKIVAFIQEQPEVIVQGLRNAQAQRMKMEEEESAKIAAELRPQLEGAKNDPTAGNKDGDVTMVIFHDHNCGYCKKAAADVIKLINEDKKLKVVLKDFPILGPLSVEKAKASVAIARIAPDKWYDFYKHVVEANIQNPEQIFELVSSKLGIDANLLKSEMESKDTDNKISENHSLAEKLNISGTPVFIINGSVIRGAAGYDAFKAEIAKARANG